MVTKKTIKNISFTPGEIKQVEEIKEREGLGSFSETVRACVRQWYAKKYQLPPYAAQVVRETKEKEEKVALESLSFEQKCELLGGETEIIEGRKMCGIQNYAEQRNWKTGEMEIQPTTTNFITEELMDSTIKKKGLLNPKVEKSKGA